MPRERAAAATAASSAPGGSSTVTCRPAAIPRTVASGSSLGERGDHHVAAGPVAGAHLAQVPVQVAAVQEAGEGQLVDPGRALVVQELLGAHGVHHRRRQRPSSPAAGRAPGLCWPSRRTPHDLDPGPAARRPPAGRSGTRRRSRPRPRSRRMRAARRSARPAVPEPGPPRSGAGGRGSGRPRRRRRGPARRPETETVHRYAHRLQPGPGGDLAFLGAARILAGDARGAARGQRPADQAEALQ